MAERIKYSFWKFLCAIGGIFGFTAASDAAPKWNNAIDYHFYESGVQKGTPCSTAGDVAIVLNDACPGSSYGYESWHDDKGWSSDRGVRLYCRNHSDGLWWDFANHASTDPALNCAWHFCADGKDTFDNNGNCLCSSDTDIRRRS